MRADPAILLRVYVHVIHEQAATAADNFAQAQADSGEPAESHRVSKIATLSPQRERP
ncbi:hypothetical protein ABZ297_15180 [Nonomuraea sp. NPDC005983]|uniref:hypothetical protein n=1 Tax=Nonomuraea sp. NPDC005983 TaxID=3155595 RepID=UPI0033AD5D79